MGKYKLGSRLQKVKKILIQFLTDKKIMDLHPHKIIREELLLCSFAHLEYFSQRHKLMVPSLRRVRSGPVPQSPLLPLFSNEYLTLPKLSIHFHHLLDCVDYTGWKFLSPHYLLALVIHLFLTKSSSIQVLPNSSIILYKSHACIYPTRNMARLYSTFWACGPMRDLS